MATEENTYFLRSFLLLVEGGLYISRETLGRECQKAGGNLDALLKQCENKLKHEFHGKQYDKLFPQYGTTDINKWDLQLSAGVLINVFGRSLSLTEKQKLRALRDLRNEIYMHCASASLDQKKYEEVQEELEDIITTLAATFDKPVRDRCSAYITQFATGPLDGVKPSLAMLNGFSQTFQKKLKVGLHTELVVGGPSDYWINLCEHTLDTILNNAESMANEGAGFVEIEKNVKKMLQFLLANKNVVFKGSKKACIILMFECNSYDDALLFLQTLDSQEFRDHLSMISDALLRHYQFDATISISASVRTECLQSILIYILKLFSSEEVAHRHLEISSETDDHAKPMQGPEEEFSQKAESKHPLRLDLECTSKNGILHILNSFKNDDFSGHLKSVADALSKHLGKNITLKASLDVDDVMAAIEEAVSRDSTRCMALQHDSEATDLHEDKSESDISSGYLSQCQCPSCAGTSESRVFYSCGTRPSSSSKKTTSPGVSLSIDSQEPLPKDYGEFLLKNPHLTVWDGRNTHVVEIDKGQAKEFGFSFKVKIGKNRDSIDEVYTLVKSVDKGGPAMGKLRLGDWIRSVNGTPIQKAQEAFGLITSGSGSSTMRLVIQRPAGFSQHPKSVSSYKSETYLQVARSPSPLQNTPSPGRKEQDPLIPGIIEPKKDPVKMVPQHNIYFSDMSLNNNETDSGIAPQKTSKPVKQPLTVMNLPWSVFHKLCLKLKVTNQLGKDWKGLADLMGYNLEQVFVYETAKEPVKELLCDWGRSTNASIEKLLSLLSKLDREDIISDIQQALLQSPSLVSRSTCQSLPVDTPNADLSPISNITVSERGVAYDGRENEMVLHVIPKGNITVAERNLAHVGIEDDVGYSVSLGVKLNNLDNNN